MAGLNYQLDVTLNPPHPVSGSWVDVTARVNNPTFQVANVHAAVDEYGISAVLTKQEEGVFTARFFVPWEADAGRYIVTFWGTTAAGEAGPAVNVPVIVENQ